MSAFFHAFRMPGIFFAPIFDAVGGGIEEKAALSEAVIVNIHYCGLIVGMTRLVFLFLFIRIRTAPFFSVVYTAYPLSS